MKIFKTFHFWTFSWFLQKKLDEDSVGSKHSLITWMNPFLILVTSSKRITHPKHCSIDRWKLFSFQVSFYLWGWHLVESVFEFGFNSSANLCSQNWNSSILKKFLSRRVGSPNQHTVRQNENVTNGHYLTKPKERIFKSHVFKKIDTLCVKVSTFFKYLFVFFWGLREV